MHLNNLESLVFCKRIALQQYVDDLSVDQQRAVALAAEMRQHCAFFHPASGSAAERVNATLKNVRAKCCQACEV